MIDLDEREEGIDSILRTSGPRLRAAMLHSPVAEFRRPRRSHRRSWIIAIATVVALVVGLVAIGTNRNEQTPANDPSRLHWVMTDLPDDVTLVAMLEPGGQRGSSDATTLVNVYATDAAPLGPLVSVSASMGAPELEVVPAGAGTNFQETTIDGRRAAFADGELGQRLLLIEVDSRWVQLKSRNIDDDALTALAQSVVRTGDGTAEIPTAELTDGLELVLRADAPIGDLFLGGSAVAGVDYANPDGRSIGLRVTTPSVTGRALIGLGATLTPTKIAGTDGFVGSYEVTQASPPMTVHTALWQSSGLDFFLTGYNVTDAEMVAAAASVEPVNDDKWNELLEQTGYGPGTGDTVPAGTSPAEPGPAADTVPPFVGEVHDVSITVSVVNSSPSDQVWSGTLPTGETWEVDVTTVFDSIATRPKVDGLPQGSEYGPLVRAQGQEFACCAPLNVVTANPDATAMRVTTHHGDRFIIPLHDLPGTDELRIALIALPSGEGPQLAELIDADGNILESLPGGT
jgi:hypothetical protein